MSVDESLILYKGRLAFKQYIKTKRARFGIKLYELCTSSGITLDFMVYCGPGMFEDDPNTDLPTSERIPVTLMQPWLGRGHVLFTDNFYTSPTLADYMLDNNTHLCGTVKVNRKNYASDLKDYQLEKGMPVFFKPEKDKKMLACKFRATKDKSSGKPKGVYVDNGP